MTTFFLVQSVDADAVGKVDIASLSEQTMMELLLANVKNKEPLQDFHGDYLDILQWDELEVDATGHITCVWWFFRNPISAGSIDFRWVPLHMEKLTISECQVSGVVETKRLPRSLVLLNVRRNRIEGTFDIEGLPESFESVDIGCNKLTGTLHLAKLPETIAYFHADNNFFSGTIDLTHIPPRMMKYSLNDNHFMQKKLVVGDLPEFLISIRLWGNNFGRVVDTENTLVTSEKILIAGGYRE